MDEIFSKEPVYILTKYEYDELNERANKFSGYSDNKINEILNLYREWNNLRTMPCTLCGSSYTDLKKHMKERHHKEFTP